MALDWIVAVCVLVPLIQAIPIDNGVLGDPEIDCGARALAVSFNTKNNFEGHVYVKGRYAESGCRVDGNAQAKIGKIELGFDQCGVVRERSLNPRGMFVRQTIIISFHPHFITKIDRGYTIQCFYMEADKTVSNQLEVSMITTGFQTQNVPMPVCRYEILSSGTPGATPVSFAVIGMPVYHKWTCDTETTDTFCMTVHTCFVDDGAGQKITLLNEQGCALDKYLLGNLEYPTDLMAGREVHVFKYADRAQLFFQCQIRIEVKEPATPCVRVQCPSPGGSGDGTASGASSVSAGVGAPGSASQNVAGGFGAASNDSQHSTNFVNPASSIIPTSPSSPQSTTAAPRFAEIHDTTAAAIGATSSTSTTTVPPPRLAEIRGDSAAVEAVEGATLAQDIVTILADAIETTTSSPPLLELRIKRQVNSPNFLANVDVSAKVDAVDVDEKLLRDVSSPIPLEQQSLCVSTAAFSLSVAAIAATMGAGLLVLVGSLWLRTTHQKPQF